MSTKRWVEPKVVAVPNDLMQIVGGHPLVATILARRGIVDPVAARGFLDPSHYQPSSSYELPCMDRAVARLRKALEQRERIWVWGDFDADGQTATALLFDSLRAMGGDVRYYVPSRSESHGLNLDGVNQVLRD